MEKADRESSTKAQEVFEDLLPNPTVRATYLRFLADSILEADRLNPTQWGVTLARHFVRLNVGMIEVTSIRRREGIEVSYAIDLLPPGALSSEGVARGSGDWQVSVPGVDGAFIEPNHFLDALPLFHQAHFDAVRRAAASRRHSTMRKAHSPGVISFLNDHLNAGIPQPKYFTAPFPDEIEEQYSEGARVRKVRSVYICLGTLSRGHLEDIQELSATGGSTPWTINSQAEMGDEVFFYLTTPRSSLMARGRVQSTPKREDDSHSEWLGHFMSNIGNFAMLPRPLHIRELQSAFPAWGWLKSPRRSTRVPEEFVPQLLQMAGTPSARAEQANAVLADLKAIDTDPRRGPTERETLGTARIGQGPFRQDLECMWRACAVTGCSELPLLRASHIKPWRASTDAERLDPYNGLLLVPNLDVAFDSGYISFLDNGGIVISSRLDQTTRRIMGIHRNLRLRRVAKKHRLYLAYHRREVFQP